MFKVAVGHSEDPDSLDAIKEILEQCADVLKGDKPNAGILFSAVEYDHASILKHILEQFPGIELIGCTSSGEITSTSGYMEGSLVLALFCTDRVKIHGGVVRNLSKENYQKEFDTTVNSILVKSGQAPKLCITLPEVFTIGLVKVVKELEAILGKDIPIVGAGAADTQFKMTETSQFYQKF